ncbi:MAG TPA: hypothetical protein VMG41_00945 [Gemmatimonadales bacterium]|nr:hypothetical protein [Gemmatimonadales bacterium]
MRGARWEVLALAVAGWTTPLAAQAYNGTFLTKGTNGATISLTLQEDRTGKVTGALTGNGVSFQLSGQRHGQEVTGRASGRGTQAFFSAHFQGHQLQFMIADIGSDGRPNLRTAQQLVLTRSFSGTAGPAPPHPPLTPSGA